MEILSNFQYKKLFLPNITEKILANNADIQLYRLEDYLKGILMPVIPYRTTFNFIIFVTNGHLKQYLENKEYAAEKGGVIFIKQGTITATLELSDDIEGFFLAYENNILSEQELPKHSTSIFFMNPFLKQDALTYETITQLLSIMEQELWLNNLNVNDVTITMLHLILIKMLNSDSNSHHRSVTRAMEVSLQFRDLLFKYHINEKRVAFFADKLSVTESYLNKCVKNVTKKSPKQWINEIDINYSKALLQSSKDIAEIAYELNFHTASHFAQLFKRITGITPTAYRNQFLIK
ncbi:MULTISPECIES: helix-turn-helix domain-containing protein [Chryseobacterium]|jgi:AraC-like DNA-binding protein|uniref:AraC-type DNA-binding protein n=2 Tax=Chryseobacterium TaxID=59732 RepID=A0AAX2IMJ5_9FLAO|nr:MULTISPECIES: helix-turn-helix domain-containing protein [Chryseobacterium]AZB30131.1 AraC family transcriptional regulator [Chryseobacterium balustinum]REC54596.1 AraC family transcriptional regulator [Chryseobacterium piscium]SKB65522.1 AraC-type DNA-binding protein [Chryseobacterium balustinum]SQA90753.1 Chb operon repressor [Chryseobacterium balustinum]